MKPKPPVHVLQTIREEGESSYDAGSSIGDDLEDVDDVEVEPASWFDDADVSGSWAAEPRSTSDAALETRASLHGGGSEWGELDTTAALGSDVSMCSDG